MKKISFFMVFLLLTMLTFFSCKKVTQVPQIIYIDKDTLKGELVADTITYNVKLYNSGPTDPVEAGFLRYLNKTKLIDSVFKSVYNGKAKIYDYFNGNELSIKDIENDKTFSRDAISEIQFCEIWYFNSEYMIFSKKVISMVLAMEKYNSDGTYRGKVLVFKIYLH